VSRRIATLAACGSGTSDTTTTEDTRGWSDEAFRDVMAYCQATDEIAFCAFVVIYFRDGGQCSVEASYKLVDVYNNARQGAISDLLRDQLHPAGDCLEYLVFDE